MDKRWIKTGVLLAVLSLLALLFPITAKAAPAATDITLSGVGSRYVNADIPIKGYLSGNTGGQQMIVATQRNNSGTWTTVETKTFTALGAYQMSPQRSATVGVVQFRTQVTVDSVVLDVSDPISVTVIAGGPVPAHITLYSVGSKTLGTPIPMNGSFGDTAATAVKTITIQRNDNGTWVNSGSTTHTGNGGFVGAAQQAPSAGSWNYRAVMSLSGTVLATSAVITVQVVGGPVPTVTGTITVNSVGSRYTGGSVPISGYIGGTAGVTWNIVAQVYANGSWAEAGHKFGVTTLGKYVLDPVTAPLTAGTYQYRTLLYYNESLLAATSNTIAVVIKATSTPPPPPPNPDLSDPNKKPAAVVETRVVDGEDRCETLLVQVFHQERTNNWVWSTATAQWVPAWTAWTTHHETVRQATMSDCVTVTSTLASDVLYPDIRIKNLNKCGAGDLAVTNNTCFKIVNPAPNTPDFPHLSGKKLLKFPVITMNVGTGPAEVIANRSGPTASTWKAYQTFYRPNGERQSQEAPNVDFYFAGDGHNHWHFKDFDDYWIEDLTGSVLRTAEKHGYCLLDNTTYTPFRGLTGVPTEPIYVEATTCGEGLPNGLTIIQGLSKGWGDTYPTTLPDQALDVSGLPNGRYRVGVTADAVGAVKETNETNNTATIEITITGNTVTIDPTTAVGGLN